MENKDKRNLNIYESDDSTNSATVEGRSDEVHSSSGHHRHSHHDHHRSSRKRHKKTNNKRSESFKRFIKQNKKYLIHSAITLVLLLGLVIFGLLMDKQADYSDNESGSEIGATIPTDELRIGVPFFDKELNIVGPAVREFMNSDSTVPVSDIYDKYKETSERLDVGLPVELGFNIISIPDGYSVKSVEYLVADNEKLADPVVYNTDGKSDKVDVYHLKTGYQYYYKINITFNNGTQTSVCGSFKTAAGPRVITVDGAFNLRDIGGWETTDGRRIKQGLLYRGCELDGSVESQYKITSDGINTMLTVLGIKMDMDLRASTDNKYGTNALGASVEHNYYAAPMYVNVFKNKESSETIRKIFSDLAVADNYPIYLHCTYGQDRTGTVCYLLEGLLGVEETSMLKDYQLSGLHHGDVASNQFGEFVKTIEELPGSTIQNKIEGWLLSIGVTADEIEAIRAIFLEE